MCGLHKKIYVEIKTEIFHAIWYTEHLGSFEPLFKKIYKIVSKRFNFFADT
jgi:hypothetical protein